MTRKSLHYLIKFLILTIALSNAAFSQSEIHRLEIISKKPFELFINDHSTGPHLNLDTLLMKNYYKIEAYLLEEELHKTIYKKNLFLNSDLKLNFDSSYSVSIRSFPDDAEVYFDSMYFGSTPLKINLLFKPSLIEIKKIGYYDYRKDIGELDNYNFYIKLEKIGAEKTKLMFDYKFIALTSTIITGALAAYTKQLANKYYFKSERTDEDRKKVKTYDRSLRRE